MEIAQENKASLLEHAVINDSIEDILRIYDELGNIEMSAQALGLACRFRGAEVVKALVQKGATFEFPLTKESEEKYHCYIGMKFDNYCTNYSLYLLKVFRGQGQLKGAVSLKGMKFFKTAKRDEGKPLPFISDDERIEVLNYLIENSEKIAFEPEEMLFYAIYAKDTIIVDELRRHGIKILEIRREIIVNCSKIMDGYWYEYCALTNKLLDENYLDVMEQIYRELEGEKFHFTDKILDITKKRFYDRRVFEFFLSHFKQEKMNKQKIMRILIDECDLEALPVIEREGWLKMPKKRDDLIEYATQNNKTEALAWLLDFKNRTADLAAEQEKAEKKLMRELNSSPDSVYELKKIWSYKKREDGTLVITNYKGNDTQITVPEKIGRGIVTAIGDLAFAGSYTVGDKVTYATYEHVNQHRSITKITLPDTIQYIGVGAFTNMTSLKEINIPEGVKEIPSYAFFRCTSLKKIKIPETVTKIGNYAFNGLKVTIYGQKGSAVEEYCMYYNINYQNFAL